MDIDEILDMDTDDIRRSHLIVSTSTQLIFLSIEITVFLLSTEITVSLQTPALGHIEIHQRSAGSRKNAVNSLRFYKRKE